MKQQVIFINGAVPRENFEDYYEFLRKREYDPYAEDFLNWNKTLWEKLWGRYEYLRTPSDGIDFADYEAWKIMFEKMFPYLEDNIILVTTSLGSTFILKYLSENDFPVKIRKLFLIAPAISDTPDETLGSIYIYHSKDDDCVPFEQSLELKQYFPEAIFREFYDRWHFFLESELPELIEDIKTLT